MSRTAIRPAFFALEDRALLAAQPIATVDSAEVQIGGSTQLTISFDNVPDGSPGGDVGYAPYVDLILPTNGADGAGVGSLPPNENDGVTFLGATLLGAALDATVIEFDALGQAIHPFAQDATGALRVVNAADYGAAPGDTLVVLRLPFGSFVPDQPAARISVDLGLSSFADLETVLPVSVVGGFAFGRDPLNNPTADPPVLGPAGGGTITPTLVELEKTFDGPENETATGPNFQRSYTITFDLAAGQTVSGVSITDRLPDGLVVTGPPVLSGAPGSAAFDPATNTVNATLTGAVLGVAGPEATITIPFYVGEFLAPGDPTTPVLDPASGGFRTLSNDVSATLDWTPLDPRDPPRTITIDPAGPEQEFVAKSIATQKSQTVVNDIGAPGLGPLDTVEYAIEVQVSDYFDFDDLFVTDLMSDGQAYVAGSARIEVSEAGSAAGSGAFAAPFLVVTRDPGTGRTAFSFDVSGQLVANGAPDGVLLGGDGLGATTFRIVYQAVVERFFLASGDAVGQGDRLFNDAEVTGNVLDPAGVPTGGAPSDGTQSGGVIATGGVSKEIYALNGTILAPGAPVRIAAGDLVTFRLTYDLPQTLTAELRLSDFLPLPVFDVATFTLTLDGTVSADVPGENVAKFGPLAGGFAALLTAVPVVTLDDPDNTLRFSFANLAPAVPTATVADILFTLRVADEPFGDGLLLTNQVLAEEFNAAGAAVADSAAIRQLTLTEPELKLTKGIVAAENGADPGFQPDFSQDPVGPVAFSPPGSAGVRFSGVIDSAALAAQPIDSDLGNVDSGALVTFAIVVENLGSGRNGAFDVLIEDDLPQGYVVPPGGLNLQVTDGAGNPLAFTGDLFAGGILLTDPAPDAGAIRPYAPTGGGNVVVITYDLLITETPQPRSQITNLGEIDNYAAIEGGLNRVPTTQEQTQDIATATIADPGFTKTAISTDVAQTGTSAGDPSLFDLTIGESITFELVTTLREGRTRDLFIRDDLPTAPGQLQFVSAEVKDIGANLFIREPDGTFITPLGAPTITSTSSGVLFDFAGDIINRPDNILDAEDRIVLRVTAVLTDVPGNAAGTRLDNTGTLGFFAGGNAVTIQDTDTAEVVAPTLRLAKDADKTTVQGGDIVTYTVEGEVLSGGFAGPAFDITITDIVLPGLLDLVAGSATLVSGPAGTAIAEIGGVVTVTIPVALPGDTLRFTYLAVVSPTVLAGTTLPNTVVGVGDSFPGVPPLGIERPFDGSATESVRVPGPGISKTVSEAETSLAETRSDRFDAALVDLAIGEEVTYRIVVTFPEAVSDDVVVSDFLPGSRLVPPGFDGLFEYVGATIARIGGNLSGPDPVTSAPVAADTNGDGILDTVRFNFGDVTNNPDGVFDARDEIEVTVTARVRDAGANQAGTPALNIATVDFGAGVRLATAVVDIVEPDIGISKTASAAAGDAGDRVTFEIRLTNDGSDAGPAYDVRMVDTIPVGFEIDVATLAFASAVPAGSTLAYDAVARTVTAFIPVSVREDPEIVITYEAVVQNFVRPQERLENIAAVVFDSHPGTTPAEYERTYGPVQDDAVFVVDTLSLSKRVVDTDIDDTRFLQLDPSLQDVAVGETVTYLVTLRLPEATTDLRLFDQLPRAPGSPPIAGDMRWVASEIVSLGGNLSFVPAAPPIGDPGDVTDRFGDGFLDTITWDFGRVVNLADGIEDDNDLIVVRVRAIVPDLATNQVGDRLINTAQARYSLADGSTRVLSQTETVEIVGPELLIEKTPSAPGGDAGDIITYTLAVSHDALSSAAAYQLAITDVLVPGMQLVAGSVTVSNPLATVTSGNAAGDTTVQVTLGTLAGPVDVIGVVGETLTITYQARIAETVRPGDTLPNTAQLAWQSAPPKITPPGYPEDPRFDETTDDAVVLVVFPSAIAKTAPEANSSLAETGSLFFDPALPDLAVGETMTYEILVTLGEGTQRVLMADALPGGMTFVSGRVVSVDPTITGALLAAGDAPTFAAGVVTFDFGDDVVNFGDNDPTTGFIRLEVTARVAPSPAAGTPLTNTVTFTTDDRALTDTATVEVVKPEVVITKTPSVTTGEAGDEVTFTVVVEQAPGASGPLYNLVVTDKLPAGYLLVAGSATTTRGTVSESGNTVTLDLGAGVLLPADDPATAEDDARVVITYRAVLADSDRPGQLLVNTASFEGVSANTPGLPPGAVDTITGSDDAAVLVVLPVAFEKNIVNTSLEETGSGFFDPARPDLAVGEQVTYELLVTIGEGTQQVLVQDILPGGLIFVSGVVDEIAAKMTGGLLGVGDAPTVTGSTIVFDFGNDVVNAGDDDDTNDTIRLLITARVAPGTAAGTVLTNNASFTTDSGTLTDTVSVDVVAPEIAITKTPSAATGQAGDEITFTVVVSQAAPGASGPLYDLVVADTLPAEYILVAGSATATRGTVTESGNTVTLAFATGPFGTREVLLPVDDPLTPFDDSTVTITYRAIIANTVRPGDVATNSVAFDGVSAPGLPPGEVDSITGGTDADVTIALPVAFAKNVVATSLDETGAAFFDPALPDLAVGETITYELLVTLGEGTQQVLVTDVLGAGLAYVGSRVDAIGPNMSGLLLAVGDAGSVSGSTITFDFGNDVVNAADADATNDTIRILVTARVVPGTAEGAGVLRNDASFATDSGTLTDFELADVVTPAIAITKTPSVAGGDAGDEVTFTVVVAQQAGATGPLFELVVEDALPAGYVLVPGSASATRGTVSEAGNTVTLAFATGPFGTREALLPVDDPLTPFDDSSVTVTYRARIADTVRDGDIVTNVATFKGSSAPGLPPGQVDRPDGQDDASVAIVLPIAFDKAILDTSLDETGSGFFDPALPDLAVGERVTYQLVVTLGEGTQRVFVQDVLPAGLTFVSGRVLPLDAQISGGLLGSGAAPTVVGQTVTFDFGNDVVNAGDGDPATGIIRLEIVARVAPGTPAGPTPLLNTATFTTDSRTLSDSESVEVVAPDVAITKTPSLATGDAGDEVTFTVVVAQQPGATGPLFELVVEDILPAGYILVAGSATATRGSVTEAGNTVRLAMDDAALLPADDPLTPFDDTGVTLTYRARLADTVEPGQIIANTATFTGDSAPNLPPAEVDTSTGNATGNVLVVMPVALDKSIARTSLPETVDPNLNIGETIFYRLAATLSEGTQTLVITDTLPAGLEIIRAYVVDPGGVGSGLPPGLVATTPVIDAALNTVTFDFGTVVNAGDNDPANDFILVEIEARLRDVPGNVNGAALTNAATVTITSPTDPAAPGGTQTDDDTVTTTVVEPLLVLDKSAPPGFLAPGETVTYTLVLTHEAASTSAAYDIVIEDVLADPFLDLVAGSVVASRGTVELGNAAGDTILRVRVDVLELGGSVTITFAARVAAGTPAGVTLTNDSTALYDSNLGPGGRENGSGDGTAIPGQPGLTKEITRTGNPDTGFGQFDPALPDLAIGETLTYTLVLTLPAGTAENVVLSDLLPDALLPLDARVLPFAPGITAGAPAIGITGQAVTIGFGTVLNGNTGAATITVEIDARVVDIAGFVAMERALVNAANAAFTIGGRPGTLDVSAPADLVEPDLAIAKSVDRLTGDAGDTFTYTVTVAHAGTSTAPAYDLVVTDLLDARLIPVSVTASTGTATISGQTITLALDRLLLTDAPVTLTYVVRMADTVEPGQVIGNTAAIGWDSDPDDTLGRPDSGSASAPDLTAVFSLDLGKTIFTTSLADTGDAEWRPGVPDLAIGEVVTYELAATLAEGTQRVIIRDTMPEGFAPLSDPAQTFIVSTGGLLAGAGGTLTPTVLIVGREVTFDFGVLVNPGTDRTAPTDPADVIRIRIAARVLDEAINTDGRPAANSASAAVTAPTDPSAPGGTLTDTDSTDADIVLPALDIAKSVDILTGDAGDIFTYTLVVTPAADATGPAYLVVVEDALPGVLVPIAGSATTTAGTATILGNTIRIEIPVLLPDAAPVVITYRAAFTDAIEPGQVVTNVANLSYSTAPSDGRPFTDADDAQVTGVFALDVEKTILPDGQPGSLPETGDAQWRPGVPDLAIGEVVYYEITATLAEGTQRLVIRDEMPEGFLPLADPALTRVVATGGILAGAGGTLAPTVLIVGREVTFDFGVLVNPGTDRTAPTDPADVIRIQIAARVLDEAINTDGRPAANSASAAVTAPTDPSAPGGTLTDTDSTDADIVLPALDIAKSVDILTGDAGDIFTYTLVVTPAADATGPAYLVVVEDALPGVLAPVAGSATTTAGTATILGNTIRIEIPVLLPDAAPVVITYRAAFTDAVEPGQVVTNVANLSYSTAPSDGRPFTDADDAQVTGVFALDVEKTVFTTSLTDTGTAQWDPLRPDLAIGEIVTYEIAATLAEGTQRLVIRDTMPEGFLPLADPALTRVVATGGILAGAGGTLAPTVLIVGREVTFDFGVLVNPGTDRTAPTDPADVIRIQIAARVLDEAINTDGRAAFNAASAAASSPANPAAPGGTLTDGASVGADIVLPDLDIQKSVTPAAGDAGDVFTYTLVITPAADATGPAYVVVVEDALPALLAAVPGSATSSVGTATILGNTIRIEIPVLLPDAAPVVVTYRAAFTDAIEPGQTVTNVANLSYSTAPTDGRPFTDSDDAVVGAVFGVLLDKRIFATSLPETGSAFFDPARPDIAAGETITYRLVATLNEGTQTLVIRDAMPPGLVAESARLVALGAGIIAGPPTITLAGGGVAFDFGTVVNTGAIRFGDTIEVEIIARRDASQPAGAVLTNAADVAVSSPSNPSVILTDSDSVAVDAVAAVLVFDKTAAPASVALGNTITYTLVLSHAAGSTAPAYEVVLADPLTDASVQLVAGSVVASAGTVAIGNGGGDATVRVELPFLLPGQTLTVTFQALAVGVPIPDGNSINTAGFGSTSAPGPLPPGFGIPLEGEDSAVVAIASGLTPEAGGPLEAFEEAFRRIGRNVLDVPAILAGTAQPGATVALSLRDANGAPIALVGITADTGGHWVANPIATAAPGPRDGGALADAQNLAGRERAAAAPLPENAPPPAAPTPANAPYSVLATEAPAAFDQRAGMDGVRVTFGGTLQPGGLFTSAPDAPTSGASPIVTAVARDQQGLQAPQSLAWNRFALDFAASAAAASVAAR